MFLQQLLYRAVSRSRVFGVLIKRIVVLAIFVAPFRYLAMALLGHKCNLLLCDYPASLTRRQFFLRLISSPH